MVDIVGASGVGKSRCCTCGGLDRADSGQIVVATPVCSRSTTPRSCSFRNRNVGFVFQFHHLMPEFDARENVEMPMRIARQNAPNRAPRHDLLTRVALGDRLTHRPSEMVGWRTAAGGRCAGACHEAGAPAGRRTHGRSRREYCGSLHALYARCMRNRG
jgi:lipoprotein-releasing system ATP-binding protein